MVSQTDDSFSALLKIASEPLYDELSFELVERMLPCSTASDLKCLSELLDHLLAFKNGFTCYEGALIVYGISDGANAQDCCDIVNTNTASLWKHEYADLAEGILVFAEDAFANQFCIHNEEVYFREKESGDLSWFASNIESWCTRILADGGAAVAFQELQKYVEIKGPLVHGKRLSALTPFVLGGAREASNLVAVSNLENLCYHGWLASTLRNIPEGTKVVIKTPNWKSDK